MDIKIFLASSEELKNDREQFEIFISRQNSKFRKKGIFFELIIWENFLDAVSQTRLQDEYNKQVASCDIFVSLFKTKVGKYTEEEFDKALETFRATGKPLIYTYFKNTEINLGDITDEILTLVNFKKKLQKIGHFYPPYTSIEDLKHRFSVQIDKFLPELLKAKQEPIKIQTPSRSETKIIITPPQPKNFTQEVNLLPIEMIYVKGGQFRMGSKEDENSQPIRKRDIADFYIGKHPITTELYMDFVHETKSNHPVWNEKDSKYNLKTGSEKLYEGFTGDNQPIVGVSWDNAVAYCKWLSKETGKIFRLLSEAEWEYAAGGGSQNRTKYAGTNNEKDLQHYAWFWKNSGDKKLYGSWDYDRVLANNCKTHPVGTRKPNQLEIHDMSGNVWEWCQDNWSGNYKNAPTDGKAYEDGSSIRVIRGGSWLSLARFCRVAIRYYNNPGYRYYNLGFRIALVP
jgi:formylglycine-generating enzyme required for sulfatase activity